MKADRRTLEHIFEPTIRLVAPLFQRPYVWNEERNWVPLWESVREVVDARLAGKEHSQSFLGAIVIDQMRVPIGDVNQRQIIDGQQRLTSLQVLLAAIRDICKQTGAENLHRAFEKFTDNDVPLSDDPDDRFKVWPTNSDQSHFRQTMTAGSKARLLDSYQSKPNATSLPNLIPSAYLFFHTVVTEWLGDSSDPGYEQKLKALWNALRQDMVVVAIDLADRDDPQLIFETLNALGTPLLPADLVKNYLFHEAKKQGDNSQKLYDMYWRPFDREDGFWRREVRQGRLKRPRIDLFLQHYLTMMTGEEVGATHLFTAFRRFAQSGGTGSAEEHFRLLQEYGKTYRSWGHLPADSREGMFFYRLDQLDTTTVYPLLLEVFMELNSVADRSEIRQILSDLESFLVRRTICGLTTKNYNRLFLDLIQTVRKDGCSAEVVREYLHKQQSESTRWPSDEEFEQAWTTKQLYHSLVRKRLRMILEALEQRLRSDMAERIRLDDKLPIEHLMPIGWRDHWPLPSDLAEENIEDARDLRDYLVHTIGNLTLLTTRLNSSVSNGPWDKKRDAISKHSALSLNREVIRQEEWNEEGIRERANLLLAHAKKLWSRPPGGPKVPPIEPPQKKLNSAERKKLRLEYWTAFREMFGRPGVVRPPVPSEWRVLSFPIGASDFSLWTQANLVATWIGVGLTCWGDQGKEHFRSLQEEAPAIEATFGEGLTWEELPEQKSSNISVYRRADPADRASWAEQHVWLKDKLLAYQRTFAERVAELGRKSQEKKPGVGVGPKIAAEALSEDGGFEILGSRPKSLWFVPKSWSPLLPDNGTVWSSLTRPVAIACWFAFSQQRIRIIFEVSRMDDPELRLACVEKLRDAGFKLTPEALRLDAKYSRFFAESHDLENPDDETAVREAINVLLDAARPGFSKAEAALREVFGGPHG